MDRPCASPPPRRRHELPTAIPAPCARYIVFSILQLLSSYAIFSSMIRATLVIAALLHVATALPIAHLDMPTAITNDQSKSSMQAPPLPPALRPDFPSANFSSSFPFSRKRGVGLAERKLRCNYLHFCLPFSFPCSAEHASLWVGLFRFGIAVIALIRPATVHPATRCKS